jgi:hypothetical protein
MESRPTARDATEEARRGWRNVERSLIGQQPPLGSTTCRARTKHDCTTGRPTSAIDHAPDGPDALGEGTEVHVEPDVDADQQDPNNGDTPNQRMPGRCRNRDIHSTRNRQTRDHLAPDIRSANVIQTFGSLQQHLNTLALTMNHQQLRSSGDIPTDILKYQTMLGEAMNQNASQDEINTLETI